MWVLYAWKYDEYHHIIDAKRKAIHLRMNTPSEIACVGVTSKGLGKVSVMTTSND